MNSKNILYLGSSSESSNSSYRADALRRLGNHVFRLDILKHLPTKSRWHAWIRYRSAYRLEQTAISKLLFGSLAISSLSPDLVWIDSGEFIGPVILKNLKRTFHCPIILYCSDDPTGSRDWLRFSLLRQALHLYDLCVFPRHETVLEALSMGCKQAIDLLERSYDEFRHAPPKNHDMERMTNVPSVGFIGTFIPGEGRDQFLLQLIKAYIPLRLRGNRWNRSPHWHSLERFSLGSSVSGQDYASELSSCSISLGLLSHRNRDLYTDRSVEIPYVGGLLCAERTSVHQLLYEEGFEAIFWSTVEECIVVCDSLLSNSTRRNHICREGMSRVRELGVGNEDICRHILAYF